jgi:hypothetical protein
MINANSIPPSWQHLNNLQIGKYGEYYAKMEAVRLGYDVYTAEVDDKGIDFVLRRDRTRYLDVQVKAIRWPGTKYVFMQKTKIEVRENFLVVLVLFEEGKWPQMYAIPSTVWMAPQGMFVDRDYDGLKSKPEFGIQLSAKSKPDLERYKFSDSL